MPTVKLYGPPKVERQAIQPPRFDVAPGPDVFGAAVGKPIEALGAALYQDELWKQDQVAIIEADRKVSEWESVRLYNTKDGAFTKRGKDAFGLPDVVLSDFEKFSGDVRNELTTDRQRVAFDAQVDTRRKDINNKLNAYVLGEVRKYDDSETENYIKNARESAVLNSTDPARIETEIERQVGAVVTYAQRNGLGAEYVKQKVGQVRSDTYVNVIDRMLANNQDQTARVYFKAVRGGIAGDDISKLEERLNKAEVEGTGRRTANDIWTKLGPKDDNAPVNLDTMSEEARKKFPDDPKLQKATIDDLKERSIAFNSSQRERRESNGNVVWQQIEQGATSNTISMMPEFRALPGRDQEAIKQYLVDKAHKLAGRPGDMATYYDLTRMASNPQTQQQFADLDLNTYRTKLSQEEFKHFANLQASVRKQDTAAITKLLSSERVQNQIVNDAILAIGLEPTPDPTKDKTKRDQVLAFRRAVRDSVASHEMRIGRNATDEEVQSIVDNLIVKGTVPGSGILWDDTRRVFELQKGENLVIKASDIPLAERRKITAALQRQGRAATDEAIVSLYQAKILQLRGIQPERSRAAEVPY